MTCHEIAAEVEKIRENKTGREILGDLVQPVDDQAEWITRSDYYSYYYAIGRVINPRRYLEIGVRYGYSIKAIVDGSGIPWNETEVYGVDFESEPPSNQIAMDHLGSRLKRFELLKDDSQELRNLYIPPVDLGHVDALHTEDGVYHDIRLVWRCLKPGGVLLIDDCIPGGIVRKGAERFITDMGVEYAYLPTFRGMILAVK